MNPFNYQKPAPRFAAAALTFLIIAVLLCAAAFTSCDSKSKGSDGVKLLESITDDDGKPQKKFEYDGKNRIVKMYNYYLVEDLNSTTTITYNADNSVTTEEFYRSGNSAGTKKFVRNGNTITVEDKTLTIDKDGYIVRQESGNDWFVTCQYQDGNRIKWEHSGGNSSNYSYDDKKSPFSNSGTPKWLLQHLFDFSYANKDNPLGYYFEGEIHGSVDYKYEYDSDGFPTKQTLQASGSDYEDAEPEITRFTYIVKTETASGKSETAAGEKAQSDSKPEETSSGTTLTKTVSSAREFMEALGSDRVIALKPGTYNLSEVEAGVAPGGVSLTSEYGRSEVTLTGFRNLTIRGEGRAKDGSPLAKIIVDPRDVEILRFLNCSGIAIDGIAAGHSEGGECSSGVFYFEGSSRITINGTAMFGSGAVGLSLHNVSDMKVTDSRIYECTFDILRIYGGGGIAFEKCAFDNNVVGVYVNDAKNVSFADCKFSGNTGSKMFYVVDATVSVSRCAFSGNKTEEPVGNSENVTFSGCEFDDSFADARDGKIYKMIKMPDGKTWMAQNLNYQTDDSWCYEDKAENCAKYSAKYGRQYKWDAAKKACLSEDNADYCAKYGRLYKWDAAKKACPAGWRLPTGDERNGLVSAVGGESVAGKKLKSKSCWDLRGDDIGDGTDDYGFSALPGGYRYSQGNFNSAGADGLWWTGTGSGADEAFFWSITFAYDNVYRNTSDRNDAYSVRCVRD